MHSVVGHMLATRLWRHTDAGVTKSTKRERRYVQTGNILES